MVRKAKIILPVLNFESAADIGRGGHMSSCVLPLRWRPTLTVSGQNIGSSTKVGEVHPLYERGYVISSVSNLKKDMSGVGAFEFPNRLKNTGRVMKIEYRDFVTMM
jgi:hypothetical protein